MPAAKGYKHAPLSDFARRLGRFMNLTSEKKLLALKEVRTQQALAHMCDEGRDLFQEFCDNSDHCSFFTHYGGPNADIKCKDAFAEFLGILFP